MQAVDAELSAVDLTSQVANLEYVTCAHDHLIQPAPSTCHLFGKSRRFIEKNKAWGAHQCMSAQSMHSKSPPMKSHP